MIHAEGLTRTFRVGKETVQAVRGLDLDVEEGELVAFLGPNGAGKSTSLRMLTTLLRADVRDGDGRRATTSSTEPGVGPAADRLRRAGPRRGRRPARPRRGRHPGPRYGLSRVDAAARADELIESLELTPLAKRKATTLSGGQRRRLDIAIGMVHAPRLLFLDEPSTGLDPQSRANLWDAPRPAARGARDDDLPDDPLPRRGRRDGRAGPRHR